MVGRVHVMDLRMLLLFVTACLMGWVSAMPYDEEVLMNLCHYVGVKYVRNPRNPVCGYIACWDKKPYHMPCAPGMRVHPLFFWGESYPCTEKDKGDQCNYISKYLNGNFFGPQGGGGGKTRAASPGSRYGGEKKVEDAGSEEGKAKADEQEVSLRSTFRTEVYRPKPTYTSQKEEGN